MEYSDVLSYCDIVIITDGGENMYHGTLPVSDTQSINLAGLPVTSTEYLTGVANWIERVCEGQIFYLGIGNDATDMANLMVRRRNTFVARLPKEPASAEALEAASIVGVVRALRTRGRRARQASSPADASVQQDIIMPTSAEALESIRALSTEELEASHTAAQSLRIPSAAPDQEAPMTVDAAKAVLRTAMVQASRKVTLSADAALHALKLAVWYMRHSKTLNNGQGLPATLVSGRSNANSCLFEVAVPETGKYLNTLFSAISNQKGQSVLTKRESVTSRTTMHVDGDTRVFSPGTTCYKSDLTVEVLDQLEADVELCGTSELRKRPRREQGAASEPIAQRQRTSPNDAASA
jgi:hypothetical protein